MKLLALVKNEITELVDKVVRCHGRLQLPILSGKYLRKVSNREKLQDPDIMKDFADKKGITTFGDCWHILMSMELSMILPMLKSLVSIKVMRSVSMAMRSARRNVNMNVHRDHRGSTVI